MPISLGGLASGIDTNGLIDGLMGVARLPSDQLAQRKTQVESASQTISSFASKLSALKTAALALSTNVGFASSTSSSSDAAVVATATGAASVGSYSVTVEQLARGQKSRGATFASNSTSLGMTGSLDIQVGASPEDLASVDIVDTDTLADVAAKISSSGARVTASVMFDGTDYRLIVQGLDSGAASSFSLAENGTSLGFGPPGAPTAGSIYETANDAAFTVDGIPVTSPTNQVTGAIGGLKLALTKVTTEPLTVQVTSDSTALKGKVTAFVKAYNDLVSNGHAVAGFGGTKAANPVLAADRAVRAVLHKMGTLVSGQVDGTSGAYRTLGSIGVKKGLDGTLTLDETKLDTALTADPESVRRLFVTDTATGATGLMKTLMTAVDDLVKGTGSPVQARIDALNAQSKRIATTKAKMDLRLADYQELLKKQFSTMDALIGKYKTMSSALDSSVLSNSYNNNNSNGNNG